MQYKVEFWQNLEKHATQMMIFLPHWKCGSENNKEIRSLKISLSFIRSSFLFSPPILFWKTSRNVIKRPKYKPETFTAKLNLLTMSQFGNEIQTLFTQFLRLKSHILMKKWTASCFESQKTVNPNIIIVKMCEKVLFNQKHSHWR